MKKECIIIFVILIAINLVFSQEIINDPIKFNGLKGFISFDKNNGQNDLLSGQNKIYEDSGDNRGYIIEFKSPSLYEKDQELKKEILNLKEEKSSLAKNEKFFKILSLDNQIKSLEDKKADTLKDHEDDLVIEHNDAIKDIYSRLNEGLPNLSLWERIINFFKRLIKSFTGFSVYEPQMKTKKEFFNAINGVVVDLKKEDVDKIKGSSFIKSISPNRKVNALIMDSVPLINASEVWDLDGSLNNCHSTQKDCLTGKGVTMGILDTGVDYTHPDLGGDDRYSSMERDFYKINTKPIELVYTGSDRIFSMKEDKLVYFVNSTIMIYDFKEKSSEEIVLPNEIKNIFRLDFEKDIIAYYAINYSNDLFVYYYDLTKKQNNMIKYLADQYQYASISNIFVQNRKIIYELSGNYEYLPYIYDIDSGTEIRLPYDNGKFYSSISIVDKDLLYHPLYNYGETYFNKTIVYNISSGESSELYIPGCYGILDAKDNLIVCNIYNSSDYNNKYYGLYNKNTGILKNFSYAPEHSEIDETKINYIYSSLVSYTKRASISNDSVYFFKGTDNRELIHYDIKNDKYIQINLFRTIGSFDSDDKRVCFFSSFTDTMNLDIMCHDYNSSYDYPLPNNVFNNKVIGGYDFVNRDNNPMDDNGHGTHCSGIAAGNGILKGVAPDAKIMAYKVLDYTGNGYYDDIIEAIEMSGDPNQDGDYGDHLDVISLSLGGGGYPDDPLSTAIDNVARIGVIPVVAAGNSGYYGSFTIGSPGCARKAITVGASYKKNYYGIEINCIYGEKTLCGTCGYDGKAKCDYWGDKNPVVDNVTAFSSRGPVAWYDINNSLRLTFKPDIVAPGALICSARYDSIYSDGGNYYYKPCYDNKHVQMAGTSMATPIVTGAAALMKQKNKDYDSDVIKSIFKYSAKKIPGESYMIGSGRLDILSAMNTTNPLIVTLSDGTLVHGSYNVSADIIGDDFDHYDLFYGDTNYDGFYVNDPVNWIKVNSSRIQPGGNVISTIDTSEMTSYSLYYIKLVAYDKLGRAWEEKTVIYPENFLYTNPMNELFRDNRSIITINGTVLGKDFKNYSIKLIRSDGADFSSAIELNDKGLKPVIEGELGKLNLSKIKDGSYNLTLLEYYGDQNNTYETYMGLETRLDKEIKHETFKGTYYYDIDLFNFYPPNIEDIDGDYIPDLVMLTDGNNVNAFNYFGELKDWPFQWNIEKCKKDYSISISGSYGYNTPAIINHENNKYISFTNICNLMILDKNANLVNIIPDRYGTSNAATFFNNEPVFVTNQIWKKNGDLDIVYINGTSLLGFPINVNSSYLGYFSYAIGDLNNDGTDDIVVRTLNHLKAYSLNGELLFDKKTENSSIEGNFFNIFLADLDNDGSLDIIYDNKFLESDYNKYIISVYNSSGDLKSGWPINVFPNYNSIGQVVPGDLNGDGFIELMYRNLDNISIYNYTGGVIYSIKTNFELTMPMISQDINNDNIDEILYEDYIDGSVTLRITNMQKSINQDYILDIRGYGESYLLHKPYVLDINNDNKKEIVVPYGFQYYDWGSSFLLYEYNVDVFKTDFDESDKGVWKNERYDNQRTSCYKCNIKVKSNHLDVMLKTIDIFSNHNNSLDVELYNKGNKTNSTINFYYQKGTCGSYCNDFTSLDSKTVEINKDSMIRINFSWDPEDYPQYTIFLKANASYGNKVETSKDYTKVYIKQKFDGDSSNISNVSEDNILNLTFENENIGKIRFTDKVNITRLRKNPELLNEYIRLRNRYASIDTKNISELTNKSAWIYFYGIDLVAPVVINDGNICPADICKSFIYDKENKTLYLEVSHFSSFEIFEGAYCNNDICDSGEGCSSCPNDCGECPAATIVSSGGPSGSPGTVLRRISNTQRNNSNQNDSIMNCSLSRNCSWGPCINNTQVWICIENNICNFSETPLKKRVCVSDIINNTFYRTKGIDKMKVIFYSTILSVSLIITLIIIFTIIFFIRKNKNIPTSIVSDIKKDEISDVQNNQDQVQK